MTRKEGIGKIPVNGEYGRINVMRALSGKYVCKIVFKKHTH